MPASHRTDFDDYDRGIRETDDLLAELLDELDRLGMSESTFVVLLSDHGEAFGEHGSAGHGYAPHQEQLHVPLIVRGPGVPAGRRVTTPASLVDVAPTLLELLGVAPLPQAQGRSLSAAIRGGDGNAPVVRPVYFQWAGEASRGVRFERWKFFETGRGSWLFDLATDPGERSPVAGQPSVLQVARDYLDRAAPGTASPPPAGAEEARGPVISEGTEKALRALGYLQ